MKKKQKHIGSDVIQPSSVNWIHIHLWRRTYQAFKLCINKEKNKLIYTDKESGNLAAIWKTGLSVTGR